MRIPEKHTNAFHHLPQHSEPRFAVAYVTIINVNLNSDHEIVCKYEKVADPQWAVLLLFVFCFLACFGIPARKKSIVSSYFATGLGATVLLNFRSFYNEWRGIQINNDNVTENLITRAKLMNQHKEQLFVLFCCWLFSCWFISSFFLFLFSWLIASFNV